MRLGHTGAGVHGLLRCVEGHGFNGLALLVALGTVREHGFDAALPRVLQLGQVKRLAGGHERILLGGFADLADLHQVGRGRNLRIVGKFDDEGAIGRSKQVIHGNAVVQLHTDLVADRHLEDRLGGGAVARSGHGQRIAEIGKLLDRGEHLQQRILIRRETIGFIARGDADHMVTGTLELRGGGALHIAHGHGEGDQGRWNVKLLEGAGHGILAADRARAQIHLSHQSTQHGGHRLAPAFRLVAQLLEVLLEAQICILMLEAGGHQLGQRLDHGQVRARELVLLHNVRVEAPRHRGSGGSLAEHRQLGDHGHVRGQLLPTAERHEHGACTDGGIEAFGKALVGGHVQIGEHGVHALGKRAGLPRGGVAVLRLDVHHLVLRSAVGGEEFAGKVHDRVAVPHHCHARILGHGRDDLGFEVLFLGVAEELVHIFGGHIHGHALLGFGDRQFGAVQALVLLRHLVEVHIQAVGKLADRHGHAARAEIVATLDQTARVTTAEQTLQLTLDRRVALLHFGAVKLQRFDVMRLGSAGGTTDAVTTGTAAEQDDLVARSRGLAAHMIGRSRGHNRTDLHTFGHIARMVDLIHLAGGQADLVAVGGVAGRGGGDELTLRKLALKRFGHRHGRVGGTGHTHRLIHVGTARQGVADAAADAGGRATERFDLGRVVVRLVLEQEQPILVMAVHIHLHLDGAGVDLLGFVEVLQNAVLLEPLRADRAHIHQAHRLGVAAQLVAHLKILVERGLDGGIIDLDIVKLRAERGVTAVIGPIRVDHLDLGDRRVALLLGEVLTAELQVGQIHGETTVLDELLKLGVAHRTEAVDDFHLAWHRHLGLQRGLDIQRGFTGFHRIDHVMLDGLDIGFGQFAFQRIHLGGTNRRTLALGDQLDALAGGIRTLIELAGQILHREHGVGTEIRQVGVDVVHLRLAEHGRRGLGEQLLADAFHVVTVDETDVLQSFDAENGAQLVGELLGRDVKARLLFHVHAKNHGQLLEKRGVIGFGLTKE